MVPAPDYHSWARWIRVAVYTSQVEIATTWLDHEGRVLDAAPLIRGWTGSRYMPPHHTICVATAFDGINHSAIRGDPPTPFATDVTGLADIGPASWYWTGWREAEEGHRTIVARIEEALRAATSTKTDPGFTPQE